jgi:thymidine phosphorylase
VQKTGCVICGQTDTMVPADKKIYALRNASGTVPSIPLITASILSKKLAESLDALILDVKFGRAAFMPTRADARKLAQAMVALGTQCGVNTRAMLTEMNTPLGRAAGNWLEVKESVAVLDCGPTGRVRRDDDLRSLVIECAAHLLVQTRKARTLVAARRRAEDCLSSGSPRQKWDEMLIAQGADMTTCNHKLALDSTAKIVMEVKAEKSGCISKCDARIIGEVIRDLGGGRLTKDSPINYDVGVDQIAKPGERVEQNGGLCRVHAADSVAAGAAALRLETAFKISTKRPAKTPLIVEIIR